MPAKQNAPGAYTAANIPASFLMSVECLTRLFADLSDCVYCWRLREAEGRFVAKMAGSSKTES